MDLGKIDIPTNYIDLTYEQKIVVCDHLIDTVLLSIDKILPQQINRIQFLMEVIDDSIESNNKLEQYEVSQTLFDMKKRLQFDN